MNPKVDELNVDILEEILIRHFQDKVKFVNLNNNEVPISVVFGKYGILPGVLKLCKSYETIFKKEKNFSQIQCDIVEPDEKSLIGCICKFRKRLTGFQLFLILLVSEIICGLDENLEYNKNNQKVVNLEHLRQYLQNESIQCPFANIEIFDGKEEIEED